MVLRGQYKAIVSGGFRSLHAASVVRNASVADHGTDEGGALPACNPYIAYVL